MSRPIKDEDKPLLVTVQDLAGYGVTYAEGDDCITLGRVYYVDFTKEVEYEYDSPDSREDIDPLYLSVTAGFEHSVSEAKKSYKLGLGAFTLGTEIGGLKVEEAKDFFSWGDESYFGVLKKEENIVGNLFTARKGKKIYAFVLVGLYFSDPQMFSELLMPKLTYLESYDG
jgi:hypothetical protein